MKRILLVIVAFLVFIGGIWASFRLSFRFLPDNAVITEAKVDEFGLLFLVTEDNQLYIGGNHSDAIGLYDYGSGRWGMMFDLRTFFHSRQNGCPVFFSSEVTDVFPGYKGFTWLGTDGKLYAFSENNNHTYVADNVKKAGSLCGNILYQTTKNEVYLKKEDGSSPIWIADNADDIYFSSTGIIRILKQNGTVFTSDYISPNKGSEIQIMGYSSDSSVHSNISHTTHLSPDNTLYSYERYTRTRNLIDTNVVADDLPEGFWNYYLTTEGKLNRYRSYTEDSSFPVETICNMSPEGVVKIEGCDYYVVVQYDDGHFVFVGITPTWAE